MKRIHKVAVLGAGTMGARIAAHFANAGVPSYLFDIVPPDREAIAAIANFSDIHLGKGIVFAKDTPNFIANRIGTFSVLNVMRLMQELDLTIEDVDALTGQAVGWPKSATFRTIDLVGLDILGHVVANMTHHVHDDRRDLKLPDFFKQMLHHKWLGDKTKGGFYKKIKHGEGKEDEPRALNGKPLESHPRHKPKFPALDMAKNVEQTGPRLRMLLGRFAQHFLPCRARGTWASGGDGTPGFSSPEP